MLLSWGQRRRRGALHCSPGYSNGLAREPWWQQLTEQHVCSDRPRPHLLTVATTSLLVSNKLFLITHFKKAFLWGDISIFLMHQKCIFRKPELLVNSHFMGLNGFMSALGIQITKRGIRIVMFSRCLLFVLHMGTNKKCNQVQHVNIIKTP